MNITLYDAPGIAAARVLDGRIDAIPGVLREAFSDEPVITDPALRTSLQDAIKTGTPGTDALIGIATNPFVLLMLATELPGGKFARSLFKTAPRLSAYVRESKGVLGTLKLLTPNGTFRGTAISTIVEEVADSQRDFAAGVRRAVGDDVDRKIGTGFRRSNSGLPYSSLLEGRDAQVAAEIETLLYIKMAGLNKTRTVSRLNPKVGKLSLIHI